MRRIVLILALSVLLALPCGAVDGRTYEQLTVGATAVGISSSTLQPTAQPQVKACQGVNQDAELRYRYDGTDPTSTVGTPLSSTGIIDIVDISTAQRLKFIRTGGTSAKLNISCWP